MADATAAAVPGAAESTSSRALLAQLVEDADLVAGVGVRLGRLRNGEFLGALGAAKAALEKKEAVPPDVVEAVEKSLNAAVGDIAPITLNELRSGWRPFDPQDKRGLGTIVFGLFALMLLLATAYATQVYNRATDVYATTIELQATRGAEQAIRLFGLLRRNQKDVVESLTNGQKDFLFETFNKALSDLEMTNVKFQAYVPIAASVLYDLNLTARLKDLVLWPLTWRLAPDADDSANPSSNPTISGYLKNYGTASAAVAAPSTPPLVVHSDKPIDVQLLLEDYIRQVRDFNAAINVGFDPLAPADYSWYIYQFRERMSALGLWILPCLYGMLGAVLFHMRRLLDPTLPTPSGLHFSFRIVLGGFAGIIVVWFWTPSSQKLAEPAFATLTSFGLAFLVGFSTDVFFQALDRLVTYLSQTLGGIGAHS